MHKLRLTAHARCVARRSCRGPSDHSLPISMPLSFAGAAEIAQKGELGIAQLVGTPNAVSFVARVVTVKDNLVQVSVFVRSEVAK